MTARHVGRDDFACRFSEPVAKCITFRLDQLGKPAIQSEDVDRRLFQLGGLVAVRGANMARQRPRGEREEIQEAAR